MLYSAAGELTWLRCITLETVAQPSPAAVQAVVQCPAVLQAVTQCPTAVQAVVQCPAAVHAVTQCLAVVQAVVQWPAWPMKLHSEDTRPSWFSRSIMRTAAANR